MALLAARNTTAEHAAVSPLYSPPVRRAMYAALCGSYVSVPFTVGYWPALVIYALVIAYWGPPIIRHALA